MRARLAPAFLVVAILAASGALGLAVFRLERPQAALVQPPPSAQVVVNAAPPASPSASPEASPTPVPTPTPLPDSVFVKVPYTPQAPSNNWDTAHEEYCEAAAVYMVGAYYQGQKYPGDRIPPATADAGMAPIVAWERQTWPGVLDLSLDKVGAVGDHFYNLQPVLTPVDLPSVKAQLAAGHPVIIPVMTHGGPGGTRIAPPYGSVSVYHVIVITGYDSQRVYTNDAGFVQGQNWAYSWDVLVSAMEAQQPRLGQPPEMLTFLPR